MLRLDSNVRNYIFYFLDPLRKKKKKKSVEQGINISNQFAEKTVLRHVKWSIAVPC